MKSSCYPVSNWRTRTIFVFGNNWHWDKKQYLWTTWQVVGSYKISPKTRLSRQLLYKLMPDQVCKSNNWLIWAGHVIRSAIWEPGPCLLLGTIGIETKSSIYGLPGKWWDLTKFPRKLSTIAPAPVKGDAWSGVQIEQLSKLGQALGRSFEIPGRWWHHRQNFLWKSCDVPAPLIKEVFGLSGHQS